MSDAPDTAHSAIITDHHFVENEEEPWRTCEYCKLARAAHAFGPIEDTDPGRPPSMRDEGPTLLGPEGEREKARADLLQVQGHKDDDGKTPFFFLPWEALEEVAYVMQYGANKYQAGNYRKGMRSSRLFSACVRHIVDWWRGRQYDPETGRPHLAHAVCCLLMLMETEINQVATDDRYAHANRPNPSDT